MAENEQQFPKNWPTNWQLPYPVGPPGGLAGRPRAPRPPLPDPRAARGCERVRKNLEISTPTSQLRLQTTNIIYDF